MSKTRRREDPVAAFERAAKLLWQSPIPTPQKVRGFFELGKAIHHFLRRMDGEFRFRDGQEEEAAKSDLLRSKAALLRLAIDVRRMSRLCQGNNAVASRSMVEAS